MNDYKLGEYKKINNYNFDEIQKLLINGHILFVVYTDRHENKIKIIRGYMYTDDESNWYRCFVGESDFLKNYFCVSTMVPCYKGEEKTVEPYDLQNGVIPLHKFLDTISAEISSHRPEYTKSVYISAEMGDSSNFGGPLECYLCEELSGNL